MKILLVINSSNNGGAPKMIVKLYKELIVRFPKSKIIFLEKIESQYSQIENAEYLSERLKTPLDYFKVYKKLNAIVKKENPNATISFLPLANIFTAIIGKRRGVKFRIASQRNPPYIYGNVVRILDKIIGSNGFYTHNVCNSEAGRLAFGRYPDSYRNKLSVINNCVESPDFSITKDQAKRLMDISHDKAVLTCVGRLHDQKNHDILVKAMQYIDNAILYLAGGGPLRDEIEILIKKYNVSEKIILLGDLERNEIRRLLRSTDVFLIPSKYEGLSNSLIEALSYGLPVVFSNIPSFTNFLKLESGGYAGILVNENDEKEYARAINSILIDSELQNYYKRLSLDKVKDLTSEKMSQKFIDLLT